MAQEKRADILKRKKTGVGCATCKATPRKSLPHSRTHHPWQASIQALQAEQAVSQADQARIMADAHFRTQASWGIGAGLLADVLILVGVVAWQKITFKP